MWKRLGSMQLDSMLRMAGKRGACRQKAATVLPNRTAAA